MKSGTLTMVVATMVVAVGSASAAPPQPRPGSLTVRARTAGPAEVEVVVRLATPPLAVAAAHKAARTGQRMLRAEEREQAGAIESEQRLLEPGVAALGGREIARLTKALNAVVVAIAPDQMQALAALPGVVGVRRVHDYELDLSETVPHIGATAVHGLGFDGTGVRVAVLDSGIDYTHAGLGGPGTAAAYSAAYGTSTADPHTATLDGLFPTLKVVGGYDFVGEAWPIGILAPDPDPIDCGPFAIAAPCAGGHGTHVADIIAGNDGIGHRGVAPGASLYAVKVCSAVATSCSGVALLQGMDFALDPDGDGSIADAVDVINLSLGSGYGQAEDDLSAACANAVAAGVVVVASAGNNGDKPYVTGSPGSTPEVISVAQTEVPSSAMQLLTVTAPAPIAGDYPAVFQPWSTPLGAVIDAPLQYGDGAGSNLNGCAAFAPGSLAGRIVLVDRGVCAFSIKISNIAAGGADAGVIALVLPGDPFPGSFGGGSPTVPGFMVSQATGNRIKGNLPAAARLDPDHVVPLANSVVSTSSRGPSYSTQDIKPDVGAPGASVSAEAGSGSFETAFGGTSGAAPMVAGAAALLLHARPGLTPLEVRALLLNTAETAITTDPVTQPGVPAPITRIGGGEVRVDRAVAAAGATWPATSRGASLSFGFTTLAEERTFIRQVTVRNYSSSTRTYDLSNAFRYADDAASGAVTVSFPSRVRVPANGSTQFNVSLKVRPTRLPAWQLDGGPRGGDGFRLQGSEVDGYLALTAGAEVLRLPWQVLPRQANDLEVDKKVELRRGVGSASIRSEKGAVNGRVELFSLLGTSPQITSGLPNPGDNFAVVDLRAVGARLVSIGGNPSIQFGITTFGARSHPSYPAELDIYVDSDRDGAFDYAVYTAELGGFTATGQNVVRVYDFATDTDTAFYFADANLDSANTILTVPLAALGLTPSTAFDFDVYAFDNYFSGALTDAITGITYTPDTPRYLGSGLPAGGIPPGGRAKLTIDRVPGGDTASPSQSGLLLLFRDGRIGNEAALVAVR